MPTIPPYVIGIPGQRANQIATPRMVFYSADRVFLPGGKYIDGAKSRDTNNGPTDVDRLQAGLLMGKVTSSGYYANWSIDQNTVDFDGTTSLTLGTSGVTELVRRIGSTGNLVLTGPPTTAGTVRQLTVAYTAVNTSTGVVTTTTANVNEVQTFTVNDAIFSAGRLGFTAVNSSGQPVSISVPYNTSWTQTVADIQTAFNATGVLGTSAVACAVTATKNMTVTFSGTGYAGLPQTLIVIDNSGATTGALQVSMVRTTTGVDGRFKAGSVVSQADGSQVPVTFLPDGFPREVTDGSGSVSQIEFPDFPIGGIIDEAQLIGYSAMDASLKTYVRNALSTSLGGKYAFRAAF
jgi:hypothetical protein